MVRRNGKLVPATWEEAFELIGREFRRIRDEHGGQAIGVIGSTRTTNEEDYLLQKFARTVLKTNNIDHHRTGDLPAFVAEVHGKNGITASMRDLYNAPAILLIGNDPTNQHPLLAYQIRNNVRLHRSRLYVINSAPIKLRRQATTFGQIPAGAEPKIAAYLAGDDSVLGSLGAEPGWAALRDKLRAEQNLVIVFGSELRGNDVAAIVHFASSVPGAKLVSLVDYANSRGAADMGLYPDLLPGYEPIGSARFAEEWGNLPSQAGMNVREMVASAKAGNLKALYVVGANPVMRSLIDPFALSKSFVVVQDMFLTETALIADVVLPAASAYEKSGTFTNTCGDLQVVKKAGEVTGTKSDFEMIVRIADAMGADIRTLVPFGRGMAMDMGQSRGAQSGEADRHAVWLQAHGLEPKMSPFDPMAILDEIQRLVPAYDVSRANLLAGNDQHIEIANAGPGAMQDPSLIVPSNDTLFTSGSLGRYSHTLNAVMENHQPDPSETEVAAD
jgi:NADH-quinone oxidoreductase subunit G